MLNMILSGIGYSFISISLILVIFFITSSLKMKNLYTKSHFFGAIDNFCTPIFFIGFIFLVWGELNYLGFIFNFFLSGKILLMILFISFGSVISTHAICKTNFENNLK